MPEPQIDFEPDIDFQPDPKPSVLSRFGKGLMDIPVSMYHQVDTTGKKTSEQISAGDYPGALDTVAGFITNPFKQIVSSVLTGQPLVGDKEQAKNEAINQVGGLVGLPMNEARQAYNEGDYARLTGQGASTLAMLFGLHMLGKHGSVEPQVHIPEVVEPPIRRALGPAPSFIAGDAGVAHNRPYTIDMSPVTPGDMMSGSGTVLPHETEGLHEIPPDLAARRGVQFGKPAYQFDKELGPLMEKPKEVPVEQLGDNIDFQPDVEPQAVKTETGIKIGADVTSLGKVLGSSLYQGDISRIATKELVQNSLDAVRHLGEHGQVDVEINRPEGFVKVKDNGKGLTKAELETVFTDLGSSGKRDDTTAIGGFGLAKAAPLLGGEKVEVTSVVRENGKLVEHKFSGTPDELLSGVDIQSRVVHPINEPQQTGVTVKTYVPADSSFYGADEFIKGLSENSPSIQSKINVLNTRYKGERPKPEIYSPNKAFKDASIESVSTPSTDLDIIIPKGTRYGPSSGVEYQITNNGMWQGKGRFGYRDMPGIPEKVIVNVRSKVPEGHADYPFTANRESLRGSAQAEVEKYLTEKIVKPAAGARFKQISDLYNGLPKIDIGKGRSFFAYDTGSKFTPEELAEFTSNPIVKNLGSDISNIIYGSLIKIGKPSWTDQLEKVGFIFDENLKGIHIPSPGKEKSAILINPFSILASKAPDEAAAGIFHTVLHEIAHIPGGGHDEDFTIRLSEIYEKVGVVSALKSQEKLYASFSDKNRPGEYTPEIQDVLQQYNEARRRTSTTEDVLGGTGIKSKSSNGGEKDIPRSSRSNGKRTTRDRQKPAPVDSRERQYTNEVASTATQKLIDAINNAVPQREIQEALYTKERGKRIGMVQKVKTSGEAGYYKQLRRLSGKMPKIGVESLRPKLNQEEIDGMFDAITDSTLDPWKQINAKRGLAKLLGAESGHVPQRNEIKLLKHVFGEELGKTIELNAALFALPTGAEARLAIADTANVMKSMMSSMDVSAPLRQGFPLIGRSEFWNAVIPMFKSLSSEKYYQELQKTLEERPLYDMGEAVGLKLTDIGEDMTKREESFISKSAEKLPYIGRVVHASDRAYVGFLNKLRADTFDNLIHDAQVITKDADAGLKIANDLAKFINTSTGRGDLGHFEKYAVDLNTVLFSPRMIASRLTMLNPMYYERLNPMVRKEALKALFTVAAAGGAFVGLGVAAGGRTSTDPTSADFMKLRIGNVRLDPFAGFQQYIVAANRLVAAARSGQDMTAIAARFGENKLSPFASFIDAISRGKAGFQPGGLGGAVMPNRISGELLNRFTPMIVGDIVDVARENPELLPLTVPLGALGMNSQDYPDKQTGGMRAMKVRKLH